MSHEPFSESHVAKALFATAGRVLGATAQRWRWLTASLFDPYRSELCSSGSDQFVILRHLEKGLRADRPTTERLLLAIGARRTGSDEWTRN
jgi:hypothetical protein